MSLELSRLPPGVNPPARYKRTIHSRLLFVRGAHDGFAGRPISPALERELLGAQGQTARNAYLEWHAAGLKARAH